MRKAILLYNPHCGRDRGRRVAHVEAAAARLRAAGVEVESAPTREAGSAAQQAREAVLGGCDTVIACGGDGTVHEAVQGLAGSDAALGVIPLGTGNALANDLGLPRNPALAAARLLEFAPRSVALGRVAYRQPGGEAACRYFLSIVGVGADAEMVYRLGHAFKQRAGMGAYYASATRQWLTYGFPTFAVEFRDGGGRLRRETATQVLAVRIGYFGGILRRLAPGADLGRGDFRVVLFTTRSRFVYLRYVAGLLLGRERPLGGVELLDCAQLRCFPIPDSAAGIHFEADGELLGALPVELSIAAERLRLLMPQAR